MTLCWANDHDGRWWLVVMLDGEPYKAYTCWGAVKETCHRDDFRMWKKGPPLPNAGPQLPLPLPLPLSAPVEAT